MTATVAHCKKALRRFFKGEREIFARWCKKNIKKTVVTINTQKAPAPLAPAPCQPL